MFWGRINNERGVSLILVGLSIIVLFGFGALAIDVAHIYHVKNQLQVAADAAALAGCNELTDKYDPTKQAAARAAAFRVAIKNTASVADRPLGQVTIASTPYDCTFPTCNPGDPIPVALTTDLTNNSVDIQVGHWSGIGFSAIDTKTGAEINAVLITARRDASQPYQPRVSNWFASIFKLLGANFDFTSVQAQAVAARDTVDIVPIIVNEYWQEGLKASQRAYKGVAGVDQSYPHSFMRQTNIDGTAGLAGRTFAILGGEADANNAPHNINGFVDVLMRNRYHEGYDQDPVTGNFDTWWTVNTGGGTCSGSCQANNLTVINSSPGGTNPGDVNPTKFDTNLGYLFTGIADDVIAPNAVREYDQHMGRTLFDNYTADNYGRHIFNGIDYSNGGNSPPNGPQTVANNCPLATIPYYDSGGAPPLNKKYTIEDTSVGAQYIYQKYPAGTKFMVMVYDGAKTKAAANQADRVTVIGYGLIQVDGYANNLNVNSSGNPTNLGKKANTLYGHAVKYYNSVSEVSGLAGIDYTDPYLIQPQYSDASGNKTLGTCEFAQSVRSITKKLSNVRLVPFVGEKYGVITH